MDEKDFCSLCFGFAFQGIINPVANYYDTKVSSGNEERVENHFSPEYGRNRESN